MAIVLLILLVSIGFIVVNQISLKNKGYAIIKDMNTDQVVDRINLNNDGIYSYDGLYGQFNLEVKDGVIKAVNVECPNHSCEKMGEISKDKISLTGIVCIPNGFWVYIDE